MPETIFTGAFNAVKKPPEWLGEKTVDLYDKLRFPKLTTEEQKMKDKMHVMLKKHYKAVGWTETAVAAAVTTWAVVRGYTWIKHPITKTNGGSPSTPEVTLTSLRRMSQDMTEISGELDQMDDNWDKLGELLKEMQKNAIEMEKII